MSILTLVTLVVVLYGVLAPGGYGQALALGGSTAAGAALTVGATAIPTFYAVALGVVVALLLDVLRAAGRTRGVRREPLPPGATLMMTFTVWCVGVTLIAPLFFDGLQTVTPASTILRAGVITSSNVAQVAYLVLGVCILIFLARSPQARPGLIGLTAGTCTLLSFWAYLHQKAGLPFPNNVFDNSPSFAYISTAAGGVHRFRGVLSEPSALAGTSLVTMAYMLPRAALVTGTRRLGVLTMAGIALYLGIVSTSTTFVVAGSATALIMAGSGLIAFLSSQTLLSRALSVIGCGLAIVGLFVLPAIYTFVGSSINDKLISSSYTDRSSANTDSIHVFLDTYGFGVGLGAARASSFIPTLLSATGTVGTLLFVAAVLDLIRRGGAVREYRPVVWSLIALLVGRITAGPDLSDDTGIFWMSLGLLSHAALVAQRARATAAAEAEALAAGLPAGSVRSSLRQVLPGSGRVP